MLKFDISATFLFRELPLLARFAKIKTHGVRHVELQALEGAAAREIAAAVAAAEMEVVLINGPLGDFLSGGAGLVAVPGREAEFRAAFRQSLQDAGTLKSPLINLGPALIPTQEGRPQSLTSYCDNLRFAADMAAASGVKIVIEPLSKMDMRTPLISSTAMAAEIIQTVGSSNVGLQFDIYHTAMNGEDVLSEFHQHLSLVTHIQFSDAPVLSEPTKKHVHFPEIFKAIEESAYTGFTGAECRLPQSSGPTLQWIKKYAG